MFSKEQMNSMYGMMFQLYPDHPVKVGDTWEKENEFSMASITMKMNVKYKLTSVKDGIAYVNVDGTVSGKGKMSQPGIELDMDLKGNNTGTMNIGLEDGYLKDSDMKMDISGDITTSIPMHCMVDTVEPLTGDEVTAYKKAH